MLNFELNLELKIENSKLNLIWGAGGAEKKG
jgi:hypothetical protein